MIIKRCIISHEISSHKKILTNNAISHRVFVFFSRMKKISVLLKNEAIRWPNWNFFVYILGKKIQKIYITIFNICTKILFQYKRMVLKHGYGTLPYGTEMGRKFRFFCLLKIRKWLRDKQDFRKKLIKTELPWKWNGNGK